MSNGNFHLNFWWLDDLRYLLLRIMLPFMLILGAVFYKDLGPETRVLAGTLGGALADIDPMNSKMKKQKQSNHDY